jgi:hypothetical protein
MDRGRRLLEGRAPGPVVEQAAMAETEQQEVIAQE